MKKKIAVGSISFLIVGLGWYLFIKKYDYKVSFKEKTASSILFDAIKIWGDDLNNKTDYQVTTEKDSLFSEIKQYIKKKDSSYVLNWKINFLNDSLSSVNVYVSEKNNSLKNRLLIPFSEAPIEKYAVNTITKFIKTFRNYQKTFKVQINGKDSIPSAFCACKSVSTLQKDKAAKMLLANSDIMMFIRKNNLKLKGKPYLQITSWNSETEKIAFDFCFPINKTDSLVDSDSIFYKQIKSIPALKVTYHGNYRYSDRTWNYLVNYAHRKNIKIKKLPVELFFNDPQQGGQELDWKAEVFMPIEE